MSERNRSTAEGRSVADTTRFPLGLAAAGIVATGIGLVLSAAGVQWGAAPPAKDALDLSWIYVNIALAWTWLLVWPAIGLGRGKLGHGALLWDLLVLVVAAIPAMAVSGFLSSITGRMAGDFAALQLAIALLAMGMMAWRKRVGAGAIAAVLATLAVALPVAGYVWAEFFPGASQAWRGFIPVVAVARGAGVGTPFWWIVGAYAVIGLGLWGTAAREA